LLVPGNQVGGCAYELYVPSYRSQALPLVLMLHGCIQSPDIFDAWHTDKLAGREHGCLVAYPA